MLSRREFVLGSLVAAFAACSHGGTTSPTAHSLRYELSPPDGTSAARGADMSVRAVMLDMPEDAQGYFLVMGAQFRRPDGVLDNSYLPEVTTSYGLGPPMTAEARFVVPTGTPEGNPFIPAGSRLLEIWATIYLEDRQFSQQARPVRCIRS